MRKTWAVFIVLLSAAASISAQSNSILDVLLDKPEASFGDAAYLALTAVKAIPETANAAQAVEALKGTGWKIGMHAPDSAVTLGDYAHLLMTAFKMQGGILYSLFPGPRYACRELAFLNIVSVDARPLRSVSGEEAVRILGKAMEYKGVQP
jgi:hypothetical protein